MIFRAFGNTGAQLPVVGQGTWRMGEVPSRAAEEVRALRTGIDLGLTHIDTAEMYGNGSTEELIGRAIAGMRGRVFLTSKVLPSNASYSGTLQACERSLERLRTDYLDLYLLHWPSSRHPVEETCRALEELVRIGKIRFMGVSNFDTRQVQEAKQSAAGSRIVCDQVCYFLSARGVEYSLIPYCREHEVAVVGYSPFGGGDFPSERSKGGKLLARIGARHGRTPRQVVLNFLTRHGAFVIPKASSEKHIRENADATGWELTAEDVAAIDEVFPPPSHEVPLEMI